MTGKFSKLDLKVNCSLPIDFKSKKRMWQGLDKVAMCKQFIKFLIKVWVSWGELIETNPAKLYLVNQLMASILLLLTN